MNPSSTAAAPSSAPVSTPKPAVDPASPRSPEPSAHPMSEEMFSITLHELRTPLSSINGYTSILLSGEMGELGPRHRQTLKRIRELCSSMTTLIVSLLTLTKVGAQRSQGLKEFVDVVQIAREVVRSLQGEVRRKKLRSAVHLPAEEIRFWIVPADLTQIFLNLLSNAVKFTPPGGRVELEVNRRAGDLEIRVSDTGVGIDPNELSKIFDEFYHRDHPEVGASQGSGLGLAIVKRIIAAYQGKVTVSSRVGRGSRFQVVFPLRSERQILQSFLGESWSQARQAGQAIGLVLCQIRIPEKKTLEILEKTLRDGLRKEDRIFRFSSGSLLAVLTVADSKGLSMAVRRLEDVLRKTPAVMTLLDSQKMQWRLVGMMTSRRDTSPTRFLEAAQARLKGGTPWNSEKNS